ncbi:hypothetical protein OEZ85_007049 [Tetradesmus obliquus]|uniref:Guanine nucleotide-binding protein subunit beta-like protein n=1 Tax=Tetradesmus obliquus TaxID=3088 RepID=A0ABY8TWH2_TETOB|nr:hypothetical protein OEZ85_007049 [Tetradesmus obliquus]
MAATLVLERGELQQTVDLLKAALAELTTGRPAPSVSAATNQMQQLALAANAQPAAAAAAQAPTAAARAAPPAVPIAAPVSAPPPAALSVPQPRPASLPVVQQPVPSLPGLPGGDGHAGWLVSGSQGTLNLWETNRGTDATEMALLCMHSQAVDVACSKLVLEPATKFLFGAAAHSSKGECISVHSLDAELGLLALRYQFAPPPGRPATSQRLMQQVVSVHGMTPGLRSSIVASYGERLLVFEAKAGVRAHSVLHDATFHFVAHPGSVVTCLHRSAIEGSCSLVSGAANGAVHLWDLKVPPQNNAPALRMLRHSQPVTGLCLVSDDRLASSSMDGSVLLWDLRRPGSPLHTATAPGGVAVLRIAPGPWGDILAVASQAGLHCLELFDFGAPMADITPGPLARPFSDIVFNSVTHDLYAGSSNGSVQVFSRLA